ncbi:hypothetical protein NA57DRAFT_81312 [Rhizodiscina lignyota]|uniref:Uncharacterized protein n=1 Tax=Rhizodiscina lignyota TaxID=1504668 RepID=A0A9P4M516_9PEZI|nr:hypothetical protein NA57DRAFT_81312 [Rhizodiscina lignyota]
MATDMQAPHPQPSRYVRVPANAFPDHGFITHGVHWQAPVMMVCSLLAGIGFAIGHHFFYQSLHHVPTSDATFEQQVNTAIGTAFAFIVRMFFVLSISMAYWQLFWHDVKAKATQLSIIDSVSSILDNIFEFMSIRTLRKFPLLVLVAALVWLIPIAAIPPPASLTVELSPIPGIAVNDSSNAVMPIPNFGTTEFAQIKTVTTDPRFDYNAYQAPRYGIQRIATTVASLGSILSLSAPTPNSSYALEFLGPALQCAPVAGSIRDDILKDISILLGCNVTVIGTATGSGNSTAAHQGCDTATFYFAWAPNATDIVGLYNEHATGPGGKSNFSNTIGQFGSKPGEQPTSLFVATQPVTNAFVSSSQILKPWDIINCALHNASYSAVANFTDGVQDIHVTRKLTNPVGFQPIFDVYGGQTAQSAIVSTPDPFTGDPAVMKSD